MSKRILVTGASGFIGQHLVKRLRDEGNCVLALDHKDIDLSSVEDQSLMFLLHNTDEVYHLAADMGGVGYINQYSAKTATVNGLIDLNIIRACKENNVKKFFYASSACVYPRYREDSCSTIKLSLREQDIFPYDPEPGYGFEKLFMEHVCKLYEDKGMDVRIGRFHTIYGPGSDYVSDRAKAPMALCRKVAEATEGGDIHIWGNGRQSRSFLYIDDAINAIRLLMDSDYSIPMNIGSEYMFSINDVVDILCKISGKHLNKVYDKDAPVGTWSRCSNNVQITKCLGWKESIPLIEGLSKTYEWVLEKMVLEQLRSKQCV